jgi:hypothetical protein
MEITEGRLEERPCPDYDGVERRAFGEAESSRGELASYAIGWNTGGDHESARMTVGIGAGNPRGGSFHIELLRSGDEWVRGEFRETRGRRPCGVARKCSSGALT